MGKLDQWSALFWLGISVAICIHSVNLGLGGFREPGVGFLFFWCGVALGSLSITLLIKTYFGKKKDESQNLGNLIGNIHWFKVGAVLMALVIYAVTFEWLGAILSTAIFVAFLLRAIEVKKWYIVVSVALASTLSIYILFKILLHVRLPAGLLGL